MRMRNPLVGTDAFTLLVCFFFFSLFSLKLCLSFYFVSIIEIEEEKKRPLDVLIIRACISELIASA
jgi:hypothetical protein